QAGMTIRTYPALVDKVNSVSIELFTDPQWAAEQHRWGVARLVRFALSEQERYWSTRLPKLKESALFFAPHGQAKTLQEDLLMTLFLEACVEDQNGVATVRTKAEFEAALALGRAELAATAGRLGNELHGIMAKAHQVHKALKGKVSFALAFVYADIKAQLAQLVYPGFYGRTPKLWRRELDRYLTGILARLDRNSGVSPREQMYIDELSDFWRRYQAKAEKLQKEQRCNADLQAFRWAIEEYRVSLFAQTLGTAETVSGKRLEKQWQEVRGL
ncbi:MAG: DUF3418 domain-containing protein, partial [Natronospirillum sp.]